MLSWMISSPRLPRAGTANFRWWCIILAPWQRPKKCPHDHDNRPRGQKEHSPQRRPNAYAVKEVSAWCSYSVEVGSWGDVDLFGGKQTCYPLRWVGYNLDVGSREERSIHENLHCFPLITYQFFCG